MTEYDEDGIADVVRDGMRQLANSITPLSAMGADDATGGHVSSLTEALMGVTSGLVRIADAITSLSEEVALMREDKK